MFIIDEIFKKKGIHKLFVKDKNFYYIPSKYKKAPFKAKQEYFNDWIKYCNGKVPIEVGNYLEYLFNIPGYVCCVHKTNIDDNSKADVFLNGLKNGGRNEIAHTCSVHKDFVTFIGDVYASGDISNVTRRFTGAFIYLIPAASLGNPKKEVLTAEAEPIWIDTKERMYSGDMNRKIFRLDPKFLACYVSNNSLNNEKMSIKKRDDFQFLFNNIPKLDLNSFQSHFDTSVEYNYINDDKIR